MHVVQIILSDCSAYRGHLLNLPSHHCTLHSCLQSRGVCIMFSPLWVLPSFTQLCLLSFPLEASKSRILGSCWLCALEAAWQLLFNHYLVMLSERRRHSTGRNQSIPFTFRSLQECCRHLGVWFVQGAFALGLCIEAGVSQLVFEQGSSEIVIRDHKKKGRSRSVPLSSADSVRKYGSWRPPKSPRACDQSNNLDRW